MKNRIVNNQPQEVTDYLSEEPIDQNAIECIKALANAKVNFNVKSRQNNKNVFEIAIENKYFELACLLHERRKDLGLESNIR